MKDERENMRHVGEKERPMPTTAALAGNHFIGTSVEQMKRLCLDAARATYERHVATMNMCER